MHVRLQTWAPYGIEVSLNGREWLRRSLDKHGCKYVVSGNKFFDIEDYTLAQKLLNSQLETPWTDVLESFLPDVFPSMRGIIGHAINYTWVLWQSEWARDYIFHDPNTVNDYMKNYLRHALISGTSERIIRYFGHPVAGNGQPFPTSKPEVLTRVGKWCDGTRIKHWVDKNSLKLYNEQNVLRFEYTMNNPKRYRIERPAEGDPCGEVKLRHMRQSVDDIVPRTKICSQGINELTKQMATLEDSSTVADILSEVSQRIKVNGKSYRALEVTGKDMALLQAISDPKYFAGAITNKHLQEALGNTSWANGMSGRRLSARISRQLRLLREHGIISKLPNQNKYALTDKGCLLTTSLNQFLGAKLSSLASLAA